MRRGFFLQLRGFGGEEGGFVVVGVEVGVGGFALAGCGGGAGGGGGGLVVAGFGGFGGGAGGAGGVVVDGFLAALDALELLAGGGGRLVVGWWMRSSWKRRS